MRSSVRARERPLVRPLQVSHTTVTTIHTVELDVECGPWRGRGVVSLGPWLPEDPATVGREATRIAGLIESGATLAQLRAVLTQAQAQGASAASTLLAEMAVLDVLARAAGQPAWSFADLPTPLDRVPLWHTVSVGAEMPVQTGRFKVKLGGPNDAAVLQRLAERSQPDDEFLVDVNRGWTGPAVRTLAPLLRRIRLVALEDPVGRIEELEVVRAELPGVPVLLDEGIATVGQVTDALRVAQGVNIKLLRFGSLLAAADALRAVAAAGGTAMVGCFIEPEPAIAYASQLTGLATIFDLDGAGWLVPGPPPTELAVDLHRAGLPAYG